MNASYMMIALCLLCGCRSEPEAESYVTARTEPLVQLRELIAQQVGGLDKLKVPADDSSIPLPPEDPSRPGRYRTSEAKRYLGKMLFHDPVRTARVNINTHVNPPITPGEPRDLPEGSAFGGTVAATDPNVQRVVDARSPKPEARSPKPEARSLSAGLEREQLP